MSESIFAQTYDLSEEGIAVEYRTTGRYLSTHWHDSLELIYILNGNATVYLEGVEHQLIPGEFMVIDTNQLHESRCTRSYMMVVVRIDEALIQRLMGGTRDFRILCSRKDLREEQLPAFFKICDYLKELVSLYVKQPKGYRIARNAAVMEILYLLVSEFSVPAASEELSGIGSSQSREKEIIAYIGKHYTEPLSLDQIASKFGLNRDYFSRMFHKVIGVSFTHHLNLVRLQHIYHDLCTTDAPILELLDRHGFSNYKLFSRMFKEIYGGTPREIRKRAGAGQP